MAKYRKKYKDNNSEYDNSKYDNSENFSEEDVKDILRDLEVEIEGLLDNLIRCKRLSSSPDLETRKKANEEFVKTSVDIKRKYNTVKRDLKSKGYEIPYERLSLIKTDFMVFYDEFDDSVVINEFMQTLANDILTSKNEDGHTKGFIDKEVMEIYKKILGNPGTTTKGMSIDYISKVINEKLNEKGGINREDVLTILNEVRNYEYTSEEDYQKLVEDTIIARLTTNKEGQRFTNPRILKIFDSLASSYKTSSDYSRVTDTYGQALDMETLKGTPEYEEIKKHAEQFEEFLKMKSSFKDRRFDSLEDLMSSLKGELIPDEIFKKGKGTPRTRETGESQPKTKNVMPIEQRLKGLENVINFLKKTVDKNIDLKEYSIGQDAYEGYVIFKIAETDISIFENFNDDENNRVFLVKNEKIDEVVNLTKNEARVLDGVEVVNHVQVFENYCKNFKGKLFRLMKQKLPETKETRFVGESTKRKKEEKEATTEIVEENKQVSEEQSIETEPIAESESEGKSEEQIKLEREIEKAHKKAEEYSRLQKELEEIKRTAEEKIAEAKARFDKRIKEIDEEED